MQQMIKQVQWMWAAINAQNRYNKCLNGCNESKCTTNTTTGATDAQLGVHELCLGARCVGDLQPFANRMAVMQIFNEL